MMQLRWDIRILPFWTVSWNMAERWEISNLAMEVGNAGNINELTMVTWFALWWADSFPWKTAVEDIGR
jgi:hypothetical protein